MDLANAIIRGFEIGISIVAALGVLLLIVVAIAIAEGIISAVLERAERKGK